MISNNNADTFINFTKSGEYGIEILREAAGAYVNQLADYLPEAQMRAELLADASQKALIQTKLEELQESPELLDALSLNLLAKGWEEDEEREKVRSAIENAGRRMSGLPDIAIVLVIYGIVHLNHLYVTRGVSKTKTWIKREADGSLTAHSETEYEKSPLGWLAETKGASNVKAHEEKAN